MTQAMAFVRAEKLKTPKALHEAAAHARGENRTARGRRVRDGPRALVYDPEEKQWGEAEVGADCLGFDVPKSFERHVEAEGASVRKNAAPAVHLLCGVSPSWLEGEEGRNRALAEAALEWAEQEMGGVIHARVDLDEETGGGVADIICAPVFPHAVSGRPFVSVSKALDSLAERHGRKKSFEALQDSWAKHCRVKLDEQIARGAEASGAAHLTPEEYALFAERERVRLAREEADRQEQRAKVWMTAAKVAERRAGVFRLAAEIRSAYRRLAGLHARLVNWIESVHPSAVMQAGYELGLAAAGSFSTPPSEAAEAANELREGEEPSWILEGGAPPIEEPDGEPDFERLLEAAQPVGGAPSRGPSAFAEDEYFMERESFGSEEGFDQD